MPSGVVPGIDISSLNLHLIRESVAGAYLDLQAGNVQRAERAIAAVSAFQYDEPGAVWDGTFPVTAEQTPPPREGALEWVQYDPNWRQFIGLFLALISLEFESQLDSSLVARIRTTLRRCVTSEPAERIPDWYTNPNLLHTWLSALVAAQDGDEAMLAAARVRRDLITSRFDKHGDFDEYNSPTYDGIDLVALALWSTVDPSGELAESGRRLFAAVQRRIMELRHPRLGVVGGPYIRAYGLDATDYVSLLGLWLAAWDLEGPTVPTTLSGETTHIHDLYFWPLVKRLAAAMPQPELCVIDGRRQAFGPITATTVHLGDAVLGVETGRLYEFARNQYFPVTLHVSDETDQLHYLGLRPLNDTVVVGFERVSDDQFQIVARGSDVGFDLVTSASIRDADTAIAIGPNWRLTGSFAVDTMEGTTLRCFSPVDVVLTLIRRDAE